MFNSNNMSCLKVQAFKKHVFAGNFHVCNRDTNETLNFMYFNLEDMNELQCTQAIIFTLSKKGSVFKNL